MKKLLLASVLGAAILASVNLNAQAATHAEHTLEAVLSQNVSVATKAGSVDLATIDGTTGDLLATMTPSFVITSNVAGAELTMYAIVETTTGKLAAFADNPDDAGQMIVLGNTGINAPSPAAVNNILSGSPSAASNPDAIAYGFSPTVDNSATINFAAAEDIPNYEITVQTGTTDVDNIVEQTVITDTFSSVDHYGSYSATVNIQIGSHG